jgi:hypothetical protein
MYFKYKILELIIIEPRFWVQNASLTLLRGITYLHDAPILPYVEKNMEKVNSFYSTGKVTGVVSHCYTLIMRNNPYWSAPKYGNTYPCSILNTVQTQKLLIPMQKRCYEPQR